MIKTAPPPPAPKAPLLCFLSSLLLTLAPPPHAALSTFLSAAYPSQSCGAILGAFYPNPVPRSTEPRTEDVREVRRGDRLNRHRGVDWSPFASCALHIPLVVAVGIPLFGVVSF